MDGMDPGKEWEEVAALLPNFPRSKWHCRDATVGESPILQYVAGAEALDSCSAFPWELQEQGFEVNRTQVLPISTLFFFLTSSNEKHRMTQPYKSLRK